MSLVPFFVASIALAVTPGPGVLYVVTRSAAHGRRAGLASVAGVAAGNLANAVGAAWGLAALFAVSAAAFTLVKLTGALYLVLLGVRTIRTAHAETATRHPTPVLPSQLIRDGLVVALFNPKTTLFFAAFLSQFLESGTATVPRTVVLGATFVAIAAVSDSAYALAAGTVGPALARARGARVASRYVSGGAFIGLGVFTACAGGSRAR